MRIQTIETVINLIQIATYIAIITIMGSALSDTGIFEPVEFYINQYLDLSRF